MRLILGSQSPRRREILSFFGIPFDQIAPDFDEESVPFGTDPMDYVKTLSKGKADSLARIYPEAIILTADTIVYRDGKIYEKPQNTQALYTCLKELTGQWHSVYTGITVSARGKDFHAIEETRVLFNPLSDRQIRLYMESLNLSDKAGGYMIQGAGGVIVKQIEGCYYNVMGLPLNSLCIALKQAGIDLWEHLKGCGS